MFQEHFKTSLQSNKRYLPFQAHSHHFWPDIGRKGVLQSWQDSVELADRKWDKFFSTVLPKAKKHLQRVLNIPAPSQIVFAQNTHEIISRWLSSFALKNLKILTTDSEFYSLKRQLLRLEEEGVQINFLNTKQHKGNSQKIIADLIEQCKKQKPDILIFSQTFFNSGFMLKTQDIEYLLSSISPDIEVLIDGYHAFATRFMDLSKIINRAYYCAGGYKYAMSGEGTCFLVCPENSKLRPLNTGWFAEFSMLDNHKGTVGYPQGADRFLGSTFDTTSIYRFNSVWDLWEKIDPLLEKKHAYIQDLQKIFLENFKNHSTLLFNNLEEHGHFFTMAFERNEDALDIYSKLTEQKVLIDKRENYLRFGFGVYQTKEQVRELCKILQSVL